VTQTFPAERAEATVVEIEVDSLEQLEAVLPAGPDVVLLDNLPRCIDLFSFARTFSVRAIAGHIQARGTNGSDCVDHLAKSVRASPDDQKKGNFGRI
jgi:hypothetical protein